MYRPSTGYQSLAVRFPFVGVHVAFGIVGRTGDHHVLWQQMSRRAFGLTGWIYLFNMYVLSSEYAQVAGFIYFSFSRFLCECSRFSLFVIRVEQMIVFVFSRYAHIYFSFATDRYGEFAEKGFGDLLSISRRRRPLSSHVETLARGFFGFVFAVLPKVLVLQMKCISSLTSNAIAIACG